ncbi:hypothetical protein CXG81DRAFT_18638 [Caulochytrium protostelioides]|uniref:Uncharacterized protein n=1 Tax=Caulochytrium protostelioides TaxID=1555241 RepID=A0A4P9X8G7_9FUNG|nr:hypothetical protein CXG81DRAFT_18638 [Caulochytrium protostelioides]|eukprot:RKP01587.1 hypothetical protein CXG81DRAFT_18638 [Caulochytrium protostelioides]
MGRLPESKFNTFKAAKDTQEQSLDVDTCYTTDNAKDDIERRFAEMAAVYDRLIAMHAAIGNADGLPLKPFYPVFLYPDYNKKDTDKFRIRQSQNPAEAYMRIDNMPCVDRDFSFQFGQQITAKKVKYQRGEFKYPYESAPGAPKKNVFYPTRTPPKDQKDTQPVEIKETKLKDDELGIAMTYNFQTQYYPVRDFKDPLRHVQQVLSNW